MKDINKMRIPNVKWEAISLFERVPEDLGELVENVCAPSILQVVHVHMLAVGVIFRDLGLLHSDNYLL